MSENLARSPMCVQGLISSEYSHYHSYPKHVWSPAGGWYAQPANWKANTAVMGVVVIGITAIAWNISAEREFRHKMPEKGRFFPSRQYGTPRDALGHYTNSSMTVGASRL